MRPFFRRFLILLAGPLGLDCVSSLAIATSLSPEPPLPVWAPRQSSARSRAVYRMEDTVMGPITARITAVSTRMSEKEMESIVKAAFAEVHKIDALMSHYKKDSDVSRLNESPAGVWTRVDPLTFAVLEESQRVAELSGGAFDVTVQPLCTLWGFWPVRDPKVPSSEEIRAALSHVGYMKLSLDQKNSTVMKSDTEVKLDLSAVAKGYAVDKAIELLKEKGLRDALVEIGGEIRTIGKNKEGKPWRIGVLHPIKPGYLTVLNISDKAVATSGDYMNFFVLDGKRYCHLMDPRTGQPISNDLCSVTVIAENCARADALATAVSVMGLEQGMKLIESLPGTEAIIVRRKNGGNELEVTVSKGLKGLDFSR